MSSLPLNGLYEISFEGSDAFLSFLWPHEDAAAVLLPNGFERAGQIWEIRTDQNNAITIYNLKYRSWLSFHLAAVGSPIVASSHSREWIAVKSSTEDQYNLQVPEGILGSPDEPKLYATQAVIKIYPPETSLAPVPQGWKFHRIILPSDAA